MRIAIYHGYELTGSGSNEYTRYLAKTLVDSGHEVHVICREPAPEQLPFISAAYEWRTNGRRESLFSREVHRPGAVLHRLPHGKIRPVYLTDKQRDGNVKCFNALSDEELRNYHQLNVQTLQAILSEIRPDILHANHLIYQPVAALEACERTGTPLVIYPHGSSIEYVVKKDARYRELALKALLGCDGIISGNREVRDRILDLFPQKRDVISRKTRIVGVGVDTALFRPVPKSQRQENIRRLLASGAGGGKPPTLTRELYQRLDAGDIEATRDYRERYNHSLPDADFNEHLKRIPWDEKILLFVGALTAGKGLQGLIAALPAILNRHPDAHLVIVGAGAYREVLEGLYHAVATSNETLLRQLSQKGMDLDRNELTGPWEDVLSYLNQPLNRAEILQNGKRIENHVHFLGRLGHSRLKYLFPCADLAVFPSIIPEAYPLVLMESLSNGVLPVVSYFSGFKDGMDELEPFLGEELTEKLKLSVDPAGRIHSIVNNLTHLLEEPDLSVYSPKLRSIAVENYNWEIRAAQMVQAYKEIIANESYRQTRVARADCSLRN